MDKCLASHHARDKVHTYCARDIARPRSPAIIASENKKKKKENEHYLPDNVFFFL